MLKIILLFTFSTLIAFCSQNPSNLGKIFGLTLLSPKTGSSCKVGTTDFPEDTRQVSSVSLNFLGTFQNKRFWDDLNKIGTALISTYAPESRWVFTVNGLDGTLDVFDISVPQNPYYVKSIPFRKNGWGWRPTNVVYKNGIIAASAEMRIRQQQGKIYFFDPWGNYLADTYVGSQPDFVSFTPDGCKVLVANEGEPSDDYTWDPEGSVTIIDLSSGLNFLEGKTVTIGFNEFNKSNIDPNIRVTGPNASVPQDLEPESISITPDGRLAYISLQENNAVGVLDLLTLRWVKLLPLGYKDWSYGASYAGQGLDFRRSGPPTIWGSSLDPSTTTYLPTWIKGIYQPDEIRIFSYNGEIFFLSANEGDSRNYQSRQGDGDGDPTTEFYNEEVKITEYCNSGSLTPFNFNIDPTLCANISALNSTYNLGSNPLRVSKIGRDTNGDGLIDEVHTFGGRSISVWSGDGKLIWDSGSDLEEMLSGNKYIGKAFNLSKIVAGKQAITNANPFYNASFDRTGIDRRSDRQGPEPEGVALGKIGDKLFAFIGIERPGGVAVYDITDPKAPVFQYYLNFRFHDNSITNTVQGTKQLVELGRAGDLGPEGVAFIHASVSPNGKDLVLVSNETSGSITLYEVVVTLQNQ